MICIILTELFSIRTRQYPCTRMFFSVNYRTVVTCCWVDRFGWSRQCEGKYWLLSNAKAPSMCKALVYDRKQRCLVNSCGICWSGILKPKRLLKSVFRASPWFEIIHAFSGFFPLNVMLFCWIWMQKNRLHHNASRYHLLLYVAHTKTCISNIRY